jgi:hypothetical protein
VRAPFGSYTLLPVADRRRTKIRAMTARSSLVMGGMA